jgi:transcriptional regulator with PAS, ATPase and Fis domain
LEENLCTNRPNKGLRSNEQLIRSIFDNAQIAIEYSSFPILEDKKITGAVETVSDITECKRAKEALQASERLFRSISSRTEQRVGSSMRKRCQRQSRTVRALLESSDGDAA